MPTKRGINNFKVLVHSLKQIHEPQGFLECQLSLHAEKDDSFPVDAMLLFLNGTCSRLQGGKELGSARARKTGVGFTRKIFHKNITLFFPSTQNLSVVPRNEKLLKLKQGTKLNQH